MVILQREDDEAAGEARPAAICVGQAAHAWISGQLARRWGNGRFARPEPFEGVCLGAEQHDVGMAEWDLAPTLDPGSGLPTSFMAMPRATHIEIWRAAPRKALSQSPYAALLVSMHGHALYGRRDTLEDDPEDSEAIRRYVEEQEVFQRDLLARMGEDPARARHNQRLVWALDFLSLALLLGWESEPVAAPTRLGEAPCDVTVKPAGGGGRMTVEPWPFDTDDLTVRTSGRSLGDRHQDEKALHGALDRAPWVELEYRLTRR